MPIFKDKEKNINILASAIEISIIVPISFPIDSLKTRIQTGYYKDYNHFLSLLSNYNHNKGLYRGFFYLYGGMMIRQPTKMVIFESAPNPFYGSVMAAVSGLVVGIPLSFVKTNYQTNDNFKLTRQVLPTVYSTWNYEIGKQLISNVAFYTVYGYARKYNTYFGEKYVDRANFINGTVASMIAAFVSYPADLIKVRKQTIQQHEDFYNIVKSIGYVNDKLILKNYWKGLTPALIRISLFGGIGMCIYEKVRLQLRLSQVNK